jgi:hypothetical protein
MSHAAAGLRCYAFDELLWQLKLRKEEERMAKSQPITQRILWKRRTTSLANHVDMLFGKA